MLPITEKRVRLSIEEKLWILNHRKENPKIAQNKIASDFQAKYKKTVSRHCVLRVLQKNNQLEALVKADPEQQDLIIVGGNDEEETVTFELIPDNEDQKLPKK